MTTVASAPARATCAGPIGVRCDGLRRRRAQGAVEPLVLEVEDGVGIVDRRAQQAVRVLDRAGAHDLQPRRADEPALGRAGVEGAASHAASGGAADHDRDRLAGAPVGLRGDGDDRVEGARDEVGELQLDDGPLAHPGGADGGADEALLGDRRVEHPLLAELLDQACRHPERAAEGADVLAEQEDALVLPHRVGERGANRLEVGDRALRAFAHGAPGRLQVTDARHGRSLFDQADAPRLSTGVRARVAGRTPRGRGPSCASQPPSGARRPAPARHGVADQP